MLYRNILTLQYIVTALKSKKPVSVAMASGSVVEVPWEKDGIHRDCQTQYTPLKPQRVCCLCCQCPTTHYKNENTGLPTGEA